VKLRFTANIRKAWARMLSISDSIKIVYGFEQALPRVEEPLVFLDKAWAWVQGAIDYVGKFNRFDQNMVMQVSVFNAINSQAKWNEGQSKGQWTFNITEGAFGNRKNLRLRGVSVNLVKDDIVGEMRGAWSGTVTAPTETRYVNTDGKSNSYKNIQIKPLQYGRALEWNPIRPPDVIGITSLHNASPLGEWQLSISAKSTLNAERELIGDILMDFHIASR
jgi:hypothetical protein